MLRIYSIPIYAINFGSQSGRGGAKGSRCGYQRAHTSGQGGAQSRSKCGYFYAIRRKPKEEASDAFITRAILVCHYSASVLFCP